jgi:hypothetical protein
MMNLEKFESRRIKTYQSYSKENKTAILLVVLALVVGIIGFMSDLTVVIVIAVVILVIGLIFAGKAAQHAQGFRYFVKNEMILSLLKERFDDVIYQHSGTIPSSTIVSTGMIKRPDRFHGEDYIKGTYKGVEFEVSDVDLKERVERRDSKGNVQVSYQTYFKGRWYIYKFERRFTEVLKISEGINFHMSTKGLVKIDTESIEFNKKFSIYASTQEHGFYLITSTTIEKFLELEKLHRGTILYCFKQNELHIGVNDRRDYMEFSLKKPINQESLKEFMADVDLIAAIINELRLDSIKFKNSL